MKAPQTVVDGDQRPLVLGSDADPPAAIVVARMTSSRLPGKVLGPTAGTPLIGYTLERLRRCESVGEIVVATSDEVADDPIVSYCDEEGVRCHRGSLNDVAGRVVGAARSVGAGWFFRANGDSPLLATDLYAQAAGFRDEGESGAQSGGLEIDIVTNVFPRSLPPGASVELIRTSALERELDRFSRDDREHVTKYIYRNPDRFEIRSMDCSSYSFEPGVRTVVDDPVDLEHFRSTVAAMDRPHWQYSTQEVLDLAGTVMKR